MSNLMRAGLKRLKKDKVFWCLAGLMALSAAGLCYGQYQDVRRFSLWTEAMPENESFAWGLNAAVDLRTLFFQWVSLTGPAAAVLAGIFIGTEYSDGTIRNKIISGLRRPQIYLSGFWLCLAGGLFLAAVFMGTALLFGLPLFEWKGGAAETAVFLLDGILATAAWAALANLISMLIPHRTYGLLVNFFVVALLMIAGLVVLMMLAAPEMIEETALFVDGGAVPNYVPNPRYLQGNERALFQLILDVLPSGQGYQIAGLQVWRPEWLWLFSAVFAAAVNGAGCAVFCRKDIK